MESLPSSRYQPLEPLTLPMYHRRRDTHLLQIVIAKYRDTYLLQVSAMLTHSSRAATVDTLFQMPAPWSYSPLLVTSKCMETHFSSRFQTRRALDHGYIFLCMFKGTQDWEFFWLRFWNLRYFFVSYVKILRFYKKNCLIGPLLGEVRFFPFFPVVRGLHGKKKNVELGLNFFSSSIMDPKYDPILVFWKFNQLFGPGTTLCVDLGSNVKFYSP